LYSTGAAPFPSAVLSVAFSSFLSLGFFLRHYFSVEQVLRWQQSFLGRGGNPPQTSGLTICFQARNLLSGISRAQAFFPSGSRKRCGSWRQSQIFFHLLVLLCDSPPSGTWNLPSLVAVTDRWRPCPRCPLSFQQSHALVSVPPGLF